MIYFTDGLHASQTIPGPWRMYTTRYTHPDNGGKAEGMHIYAESLEQAQAFIHGAVLCGHMHPTTEIWQEHPARINLFPQCLRRLIRNSEKEKQWHLN